MVTLVGGFHAISIVDYNKRLILLSLIQLNGGHSIWEIIGRILNLTAIASFMAKHK
jgi:hypothetical protein